MSRFKKGESGNPQGRKRGTRNRTTAELQQALLKLLDDNLNELSEDLKALKPKDRATLLLNLAKHVTPPALQPERLTEEQLEQIIQYLKDNGKKTT
jgi:hypothetical protein